MTVEQRKRPCEAAKGVSFQSEEDKVSYYDHLGAQTTPGALEEAWSRRRGSRRWWRSHPSYSTFLPSSQSPQRWYSLCSRARRGCHVKAANGIPIGLSSSFWYVLVMVLLTSLGGIPVATAETCTANEAVIVSSNTSNLASMFDCEDGDFVVQWTGSVTVTESIRVGFGTKVSIFGTNDNGLTATSLDDGGSSTTQREEGSAVVAGTESGPMFVAVQASLYFEKLALRQAVVQNISSYGYSSGGGINVNYSNVTFVGCEIADMFADAWGGGIFANNSRVIVRDTVFRNCSAGKSSEYDYIDNYGEGGGIGVFGGDLLVDNCYFEECYASKKGGAIHLSIGRATVSNSLFKGNSAGRENDGDDMIEIGEGADFSMDRCYGEFDGDNAACLVNDNVFHGSWTGRKGAVMQVGGGDDPMRLEINRCIMVKSSCGKDFDDDPQGEGGVISIGSNVEVIMRDATVNHTSAGKKGGAIVLASSDSWDSPGGTLVIVNSTFSYCEAQGGAGGVIYLSEYSTVNITGTSNRFLFNQCEDNGGVLFATRNTRINIEGGLFYRNLAGVDGAVLSSGGEVRISGGRFMENSADIQGGVWVLKTEDDSPAAVMVVDGGLFINNRAEVGGVGLIDEEAQFVVSGGKFTGNFAQNGGVFVVEEDASFEVIGGTFVKNEASYGGFLFKSGRGNCSCSGTTIEGHVALDGGAVYAYDDAVLDWQCNLVGNDALSGPAIYARDDSEITMNGVQVLNNTISRGSVVFLVSSKLWTYEVNFSNSVGLSDATAVQADMESWFIAEDTAFVGFNGETVVHVQGKLYLDGCDFSQSSAEVLVDSLKGAIVRNALLGNANYERPAQEASNSGVVPNGDSLITEHETCEDASICNGTMCLDGDLGVYCECFLTENSKAEICLSTQAMLELSNLRGFEPSFHPTLIEGQLLLSLESNDLSTSLNEAEGVIWNASAVAEPSVNVTWTIFPDTGILRPGLSIILRVVGKAGNDFDGTANVSFTVSAMGSSIYDDETSTSLSDVSLTSTATLEGSSHPAVSTVLTTVTEITFYHCDRQTFWDREKDTCRRCQNNEKDAGELEGVDCSSPGEALPILKITKGYWRAGPSTLVIHKCFHEDACLGGREPEEYCKAGYKGPYCAVCDIGYGRGAGKSCHKCTTEFLILMYLLLAMGLALTIVVGGLLAVYLVRGGAAFTSTVGKATGKATAPIRLRPDTCPEELSSTSAIGDPISTSASPPEDPTSRKKIAGGGGPGNPRLHIGHLVRLRNASRVVACGPRRKVANSWETSSTQGVNDFGDCYDSSKCEGVTNELDGEPGGKGSRGLHSGLQDRTWEIFNPSEERSATTSKVVRFEEKCNVEASVDRHDGCGARSGIGSISNRTRSNLDASRRVVAPETLPVTFIWDTLVNRDVSKPALEEEARLLEDVDRTITVTSVNGEPTSAAQKRGHVLPNASATVNQGGRREDKRAATSVGEALRRLPLTKIKIVIVVWQITSASTEITQTSFPQVYRRFLGVIGIFTFDLEWLLSASCVTNGMAFYTKLLIATLGPFVVFGFLIITFFIGSRGSVTNDKRRHRTSPGFTESLNDRSPPPGRLPRHGDSPRERQKVEQAGCTKPRSISWGFEASPTDESVAWDRNISIPTFSRDLLAERRLKKEEDANANDSRHPLVQSQRSVREMVMMGPGDGKDFQQSDLWRLFARHTTVMLITLHLVYPQVSTVVLQTFSCLPMDEIGKVYLWADLSTECYTVEHKAFMVYSGIMIAIYPVGIPLAFWYLLYYQRSRLNPPVEKNDPWDLEDAPHVLEKKMLQRKTDESVSPTAFLWAAYLPHRYFFEVLECIRRLLLTALLVFTGHLAAGQVAMSCILAFVSMLVFELLRPQADKFDAQLYRTGCLVIFFSNFLALMIEVNVAEADSASAEILGIFAVILNVLFFLSIWWNTYADIKRILREKRVKDMIPGVRDVSGEDESSHISTGVEVKERSRGHSASR